MKFRVSRVSPLPDKERGLVQSVVFLGLGGDEPLYVKGFLPRGFTLRRVSYFVSIPVRLMIHQDFAPSGKISFVFFSFSFV